MTLSDLVPGLADGYAARLVPCPECGAPRGGNCFGGVPPHPQRIIQGGEVAARHRAEDEEEAAAWESGFPEGNDPRWVLEASRKWPAEGWPVPSPPTP